MPFLPVPHRADGTDLRRSSSVPLPSIASTGRSRWSSTRRAVTPLIRWSTWVHARDGWVESGRPAASSRASSARPTLSSLQCPGPLRRRMKGLICFVQRSGGEMVPHSPALSWINVKCRETLFRQRRPLSGESDESPFISSDPGGRIIPCRCGMCRSGHDGLDTVGLCAVSGRSRQFDANFAHCRHCRRRRRLQLDAGWSGGARVDGRYEPSSGRSHGRVRAGGRPRCHGPWHRKPGWR